MAGDRNPEVQAAAQPYDMAALADMISAKIDMAVERATAPLRAEIVRLQGAAPKFVKLPNTRPPRRRSYVAPEELRKAAMRNLTKGQNAHGQTRWLDTPEGRKNLPEEYWPVFGPGDLVRINPDAQVWGGDGRTWGEILPNIRGNEDGLGEVLGTLGMTETWEPKYKVAVRGFSNGAVGLRESELLPYEPAYA